MRILEIETFGRGGLIHYAYNLSCALAERGHDVVLATHRGYELDQRSVPANVEIVKPIGAFSHRHPDLRPKFIATAARRLEAILDAFRVARLVRRLKPDVVHLHCTNPISLLYLMLLKRCRVPLVATAHVVTPHEQIPLQQAIYRRVHLLPDLIVAHSNFDRQRLIREFSVAQASITVIPHGEYGFFDRALGSSDRKSDRQAARRRFGVSEQAQVALFFGYIREYKGLDLLLDAWPEVQEAIPDAQLLIAGDPVRLSETRHRELEARAEELGAVHRFDYIPFSEVADYFAAADLLVMPYRHISQSGVLYLALSLGVPVLATRVGALPEVLQDGESGYLVPPEDPARLANALKDLLRQPDLRQRLAQGGLQVAERHSWPSIAEQTETAFDRAAVNLQQRS